MAIRQEDDREALLRKWRPFLLGVTRAVCKHPQDVDDAFQEAQLCFLKVFPAFPGGNCHAWIGHVVRRRLYTWFERQRPYRSAEMLVDNFDALSSLLPAAPDIADGTLDRLEQEDWLAQLSPPFAEAVDLCIREGLQQTRAAEAAGWRVNTMKSRLDRAKAYLRAISGAEDIDVAESQCRS